MSKKRDLEDSKKVSLNLTKKFKKEDEYSILLQRVRDALKENDMDKVKDLLIYDENRNVDRT